MARVGILAAIALFHVALHAASSVTLAWDASPSPNIAGYTVRYGTVSGVYPSSQNAGNALTTTISTLNAGTQYYFVVTARTTAGLESDPSNQIAYTPPVTSTPNVLPTLNAISSVTISEDAAPQTIPLAGITAGIGDLLQLLTLTATSSNPSLIPAPAVTYTSPNTTGSLRLTPAANSSGTATITVSVKDGGLLNNLLSRTFTVTVNPVNDVPTLSPLNNFVLTPNAGQQTVSLSGIGSGAANESQPLTVTAASSNPGLIPTPTVTYASPGATGTLRFTPVVNASGTATITVMVNDGQAANNVVTRTFTVTVSAGNAVPTLNAIANVAVSEDAGQQTVNLAGITSGSAGENQTLTVSATSSNPALVPNPTVAYTGPGTTGTLRFTPVANASGTATITVTVNDGQAANNVISRTFAVTVSAANDVPTLNPLSNLALAPNAGQQTVSLTGIGAGAVNESQPLSVAATSSNPSLIPTPTVTYASPGATGTLRFTPVANASGTATITVMVNDGQPVNGGVSRTFTVTVSAGNVAPTLNAIANIAISEDAGQQTVNLGGITSGSASESQALTMWAASSNPALVPNPTVTYTSPGATGTLRFTPVANAGGTATITVTVNDGQSANNVVSRTFVVSVGAVNDVPKLNPLNNLSLAINAPRQTISLAGISSGAADENQPLTVTAASNNPGLIPTPTITYASPGATGSLAFTPVAGATGTATITVWVFDGQAQNNLISRSFTVTVTGSAVQTFYVEAESGTRSSPMTVASDWLAANGQYVQSSSANLGTISIPLNIAKAGNYWVWCRVLSPDNGSDSFFVKMDGGAEEIYPTAINAWSPTWQWSRLNAGGSPRSYSLAQGAHTLVFRCREARTLLDAIYVSNDPGFIPGVAASPALAPAVEPDPEVAGGDGAVPSDSVGPEVSELEVVHTDARTITLRWRTDEPALCQVDYDVAQPLSGRTLAETSYSTEHSVSLSQLQSETSYLIQVHSIDAAGNVSVTEIGQASTARRNILHWTAETPQYIRPYEPRENPRTNETASGSSAVGGQRSVSLPVSVEAASGYTIWCRLWVQEPGDASFLVSVDDAEDIVFSPADDGLQPGWRWIRVGDRPVQLDTDFHQFVFKVLPAGMWFDELILSNDPEWLPED